MYKKAISCLVLIGLFFNLGLAQMQTKDFDIIIKNGRIVDGIDGDSNRLGVAEGSAGTCISLVVRCNS